MWSIVRWKCEFEGWLKLRYDWSLQFKIHISNRFLGVFVQSNGCVAAVHIEHLLWNMLITPKSCSIFSFTFGCKLSFRRKESKVLFCGEKKCDTKIQRYSDFLWNIVRWKCEFGEWLKLRYDWSPQFKIHIFNRFLGVFVQSNGCVAAVHIEHLLWSMLIAPKSCAIFSFTFGCKLSFRRKESKVLFCGEKKIWYKNWKVVRFFVKYCSLKMWIWGVIETAVGLISSIQNSYFQ